MKIPTKSLLLYLSFQEVQATPFQNNHVKSAAFFNSRLTLDTLNSNTNVVSVLQQIRGGESATSTSTTASTDTNDTNDTIEKSTEEEEIESLEDRVHAAMRKLGLSVDADADTDIPADTADDEDDTAECKDGVSTIDNGPKEDIQTMTTRLSNEMEIDQSIVYAALASTLKPANDDNNDNDDVDALTNRLDENAAKEMIEYEVAAIKRVMEDCDEVKQLVEEGHDKTLSRRALAFADMDVETARVILIADEEDAKADEEYAQAAIAAHEKQLEEEEKQLQLQKKKAALAEKRKKESELKTVTVDANFDPTKPVGAAAATPPPAVAKPQGAPSPAKKEDVVFQATSANIQKLVLESPVPVLLDVYADWCGPCKALTPALEDMAIKGGGMFRLVKLNTDEERNISSALEVQSLPTVFGVKDGKIVNAFKGMPRNEEFMKNFMMGLFGAAEFNPKVTDEEQLKYDELSNKLIKVAGAAGFSFSQRERLQVRTNNKLDELVKVRGDMADAEESAKILRSLLSNVIRDPFDMKFRRVNLENKIIAARVGAFTPAVSILKSVGFAKDAGSPQNALILGRGKKIVNVAPFVVARDTIDKWIDMNRRAIATAVRKKKDEIARKKLLEEAEDVEEESDEEEEVQTIDPNACTLKVRLQGKNKIHEVALNADDPLSAIIDALPINLPDDEEIQITCAARRLIVKSSNTEAMEKSLRSHRLVPSASVVVKVMSKKDDVAQESGTSIKERAAARRSKKKGEHTMHSIGVYAKDDNAKGELIDGGGGVWYEHDVSDDEEEPAKEEDGEDSKDDKSD